MDLFRSRVTYPVAAEAGSPILSFCQIHSQKDNQVRPATLTSHNAGLLHLTVHTDSMKSKLGTLNNMHESNAYTLVSNRWLRGKSSLGGSCAATSSHFPSQPQATTKTMQKESSRPKWALQRCYKLDVFARVKTCHIL